MKMNNTFVFTTCSMKSLVGTNAPFLHLYTLKENSKKSIVTIELSALQKAERFFIDGNKCKSRNKLWKEISKTMSFPSYCGQNWDAIEECLTDLEWLPCEGWILVFTNAINILIKEKPTELNILLDMLNDVGNEWSQPRPEIGLPHASSAKPFHVIFEIPLKDKHEFTKRIEEAYLGHRVNREIENIINELVY